MKRRSFLTALIACAAPAIVRASSLMPVVPRRDLSAGTYEYLPAEDFSLYGDFTLEFWHKPEDEFLNITTVCQMDHLLICANGEIVPSTETVFRVNNSGFIEVRR
jgi:hypothetical protein